MKNQYTNQNNQDIKRSFDNQWDQRDYGSNNTRKEHAFEFTNQRQTSYANSNFEKIQQQQKQTNYVDGQSPKDTFNFTSNLMQNQNKQSYQSKWEGSNEESRFNQSASGKESGSGYGANSSNKKFNFQFRAPKKQQKISDYHQDLGSNNSSAFLQQKSTGLNYQQSSFDQQTGRDNSLAQVQKQLRFEDLTIDEKSESEDMELNLTQLELFSRDPESKSSNFHQDQREEVKVRDTHGLKDSYEAGKQSSMHDSSTYSYEDFIQQSNKKGKNEVQIQETGPGHNKYQSYLKNMQQIKQSNPPASSDNLAKYAYQPQPANQISDFKKNDEEKNPKKRSWDEFFMPKQEEKQSSGDLKHNQNLFFSNSAMVESKKKPVNTFTFTPQPSTLSLADNSPTQLPYFGTAPSNSVSTLQHTMPIIKEESRSIQTLNQIQKSLDKMREFTQEKRRIIEAEQQQKTPDYELENKFENLLLKVRAQNVQTLSEQKAAFVSSVQQSLAWKSGMTEKLMKLDKNTHIKRQSLQVQTHQEAKQIKSNDGRDARFY
eukprot:403333644